MHLSPAERPAMIQLRDVHVTLSSAAGPVKILRGVSLDVDEGSSVSVVGPSGSGKSTLLAVIGGIERPTAGTVRIAGRDLGDLDEDELASFRGRQIGILFQQFHLIPTMTALENVAVPLELAGARDAFDQAEERLAEVGLAQRAEHYPGQLSGGEQQRVALARAMSNQPKLLLADEPTGNLDQETGREIIELLFRVQRQRGMTLLLITHEPPLAARCTHQLRMADGRLHQPVVAGQRPRAVSGSDIA
jgi:putative ABC transport system ATP-binding protein